jgi:hypothetical protein
MTAQILRSYSCLFCCLDILSSCLRRYFSTSAFNGTAVEILYYIYMLLELQNLQKTFCVHYKDVPQESRDNPVIILSRLTDERPKNRGSNPARSKECIPHPNRLVVRRYQIHPTTLLTYLLHGAESFLRI